MPAVAGLQVLQRRQPRAVLQRGVREVLVALPAASQLLHKRTRAGTQEDARADRLSTGLPTRLVQAGDWPQGMQAL